MALSYDLSALGPDAFENMVNFLVLKAIGLGSSGFGPGADGGRDGYFAGEAPYPSETDRWKGIWYIQSKFLAPHLSTDPHKWLIQKVKEEIKAFESPEMERKAPDNWIIATNIDPSGRPETGSFDAIRRMVKGSEAFKKANVHVWGGRKILDLLLLNPEVATSYGHFLTPGHVLTKLFEEHRDRTASDDEVLRYLIATQFSDHLFTKLDQAGSSSDTRPTVHDLFIDLPFLSKGDEEPRLVLSELARSCAQNHRYSLRKAFPDGWTDWCKRAQRARVALIKGGPGQGKSTVGQYLCQIHRAHLILGSGGPVVLDAIRQAAVAVRKAAERDDFWPSSPRIPFQIELKEYAHWFSQRQKTQSKSVLAFMAELLSLKVSGEVLQKSLKRVFSLGSWLIVFDGLDEVPNDYKDAVASEVLLFINDVLIVTDSDAISLCTSRPQGYSGQFSGIDGPVMELVHLTSEDAMRCAVPLLKFQRQDDEAKKSIEILKAAIASSSVKELMTTPLQSHIMAIVIRDGGRPPERRWQLFNSFYLVMKKRESMKNFQNERIARLLREEDRLLKSVHTRLGFVLHARAERSEGAQTTLSRQEFALLVNDVVRDLVSDDIEETVACVMEATTERLVLVSTPESGDHVRFDIRQLQEFFAAEFLYEGTDGVELGTRIETIGGDAHWREVIHFLVSALIENRRTTELAVTVQMLRKLNEGEEASSVRFFARRMARGTLLAGRLLAEGVLEQDQRDRQQLKPLFEPLGGLCDVALLSSLAHIGPEKSRRWLVQQLLDMVATANYRESFAALFLLGRMLPDGSASEMNLKRAFVNLPREWQERLVQLWEPQERYFSTKMHMRRGAKEKISDWVIHSIIDILNSDEWCKYNAATIANSVRILKEERKRVVAEYEKFGLSKEFAKAIEVCFDEAPTQPSDETIDGGILRVKPLLNNWKKHRLTAQLRKINADACAASAAGAFKILFKCVSFGQKPTQQTLVELAEQIEVAGYQRIAVLPITILAMIPLSGQYAIQPYQISPMLLNCVDTEFSKRLSQLTHEELPPICMTLDIAPAPLQNADAWRRFALVLPRAALELAFRNDLQPWKIKTEFVDELVALFDALPGPTLRTILSWGYLVGKPESALLERLKQAAAEATTTFPVGGGAVLGAIMDIQPFKLVLPQDLPILRFLAPEIVYWDRRNDGGEYHGISQRPDGISSVIEEYGLSQATLRTAAEDCNLSKEIRAAALALFWLGLAHTAKSDESRINYDREKSLYAELANATNREWFTYALISGVLVPSSEVYPPAASVANFLLEICDSSPSLEKEISRLLGTWRERSTAPVYSKQILERWLGYGTQVPSYAK